MVSFSFQNQAVAATMVCAVRRWRTDLQCGWPSRNHPTGIQKTFRNHPTGIQKSFRNHPTGIQKSSRNHPSGIQKPSLRYSETRDEFFDADSEGDLIGLDLVDCVMKPVSDQSLAHHEDSPPVENAAGSVNWCTVFYLLSVAACSVQYCTAIKFKSIHFLRY